MLHLRVTVPADLAQEVQAGLVARPGVAHVAQLRGAATRPAGDLLLCDVARESADAVVEWLQDLGLHHHGAITISRIDTVVSDAAADAERSAPGHGTDALVWEVLESDAREDAALTSSLVVLTCVAAMIAGIGILLDSPILIVGAMVVGPEYGPVSAASVWSVRARWREAGAALATLVVTLVTAMAATAALVGLLRGAGLAPDGYDLSERELTAFISPPDALGAVVAVLAGVAGMLSRTEARTGTLVGVLVSVTTIPAAANVGVAAAYGAGAEVVGSAVQLLVNLVGLLAAGAATLAVQARLTERAST